jgi:hypothetical protein
MVCLMYGPSLQAVFFLFFLLSLIFSLVECMSPHWESPMVHIKDISVNFIAVAQRRDPVSVGIRTGSVKGCGQTCNANPETHIKRQATRHGCLSSLLGDGDN